MAIQKESDSIRIQHKKHLKDLNDKLLPKFKIREAVMFHLKKATDPALKRALEERALDLRNEITVEFIEGAKDLLDAIAYNWSNNFQHGDAQSFIYENVLDAVVRYKTTKKCKFSTFFWMHNQNLLRNQAKKLRADKWDIRKTYSLDAIVAGQDSNEGTSYASFIITEKSYDNHVLSMILKELYKKGTSKQRKVLKRLYLGYSQSEVARRLGVTGTNINTVIRQLRQKLEKI